MEGRRRTSWFCPLAIRFSQADISHRFSKEPHRGRELDATIDGLVAKEVDPLDFEPLLVVAKRGQWPVALSNRRLYVFRVAYALGGCEACPCDVVCEDDPRVQGRFEGAFSSINGGLRVQVSGAGSRYKHLQNGPAQDEDGRRLEPAQELVELCAVVADKAQLELPQCPRQCAQILATEGYNNVNACYSLDEASIQMLSTKGLPARFLFELRTELALPIRSSHWADRPRRRHAMSPRPLVRDRGDALRRRRMSPVKHIEVLSEVGAELYVMTDDKKVRYFKRDPPCERVADEWVQLPAGCGGLQEHLSAKIVSWLTGTPLARIVQFRGGFAGRTPTIEQRGLAEGGEGPSPVVHVSYRFHGLFSYRRSPDKMPEECSPQQPGTWKPVVWLEKQETYGSTALQAPLPNRVAEWLEGRRLSPRGAV
eukprot:TRINITY_DN101840_c0_g1_i1.p1 TRINITY_DN101840_c0_g1~~TRINITY_DN101840_c0_g1_i1.p1  ORF type:complete len:444 (+),score=56.72 TRINITY_DN101840_c0_g1_i1:61-1332(+)